MRLSEKLARKHRVQTPDKDRRQTYVLLDSIASRMPKPKVSSNSRVLILDDEPFLAQAMASLLYAWEIPHTLWILSMDPLLRHMQGSLDIPGSVTSVLTDNDFCNDPDLYSLPGAPEVYRKIRSTGWNGPIGLTSTTHHSLGADYADKSFLHFGAKLHLVFGKDLESRTRAVGDFAQFVQSLHEVRL